MTACARWREELIDHALGRPAAAALSAHLVTCADCAGALAQWRARSDQLDAGTRALVLREPPASLRSRVLAGIDSPPHRFAWKWGMRTAVVGAGLVASIVAVMFGVGTLEQEHARSAIVASAAATLSHWRAPTDVLLRTR